MSNVSDIIKEAGLGTFIGKTLVRSSAKMLNNTYNPAKAGKLFAGLALGSAAYELHKNPNNIAEIASPLVKDVKTGGNQIVNAFRDNYTIPTAVPTSPGGLVPTASISYEDEVIEKFANDVSTSYEYLCEKYAEEDQNSVDPVKSLILSAGSGTLAGVGGYVGFNAAKSKINEALENPVAHAVFDTAAGKIGKDTMNSMTRNRPFSGFLQQSLTSAGKALGRQGDNFNFKTITGNPPLYKSLGAGAAMLAGLTAAGAIEDYVSDKVRNKLVESKQAEVQIDDIIKEAGLSDYQSRIVADKIIRPAVTTSVFLGSLALLSKATGHNLYGGFEKLNPPQNDPNVKKTVIDIPLDDKDNQPKTASEDMPGFIKDAAPSVQSLYKGIKGAFAKDVPAAEKEYTGTMADMYDEPLQGTSDRLKGRIDAWADKHKFTKAVSDTLSRDHDYSGRKGLGHLVVEEAPSKVIEGLAYATPMLGVALLTGRNLKRGLTPIDQTNQYQGTPPTPGTARLTIEENRGNQ